MKIPNQRVSRTGNRLISRHPKVGPAPTFRPFQGALGLRFLSFLLACFLLPKAFSQLAVPTDSQVGNQHLLGFSNTFKIADSGCLLVCQDMVFRYFGLTLTPDSLNEAFRANHCFASEIPSSPDSARILPANTPNIAPNRIVFDGRYPFDRDRIATLIKAGVPPILKLQIRPATKSDDGTHFIVLTSLSGASDFTGNDPIGGVKLASVANKYPPSTWRDLLVYRSKGLSDGLYSVPGQSAVFWVKDGQRTAFPTWECLIDWWSQPGNAYGIQTTDAGTLYSTTTCASPFAHLVKTPTSSAVYWVCQSFNGLAGSTRIGHQVVRPIANWNVFLGMFRESDILTISEQRLAELKGPWYNESANMVWEVEPRIVVMDGPFPRFANGNFSIGARYRNLSSAGTFPFDVTARICHLNGSGQLDGQWLDFPWTHSAGLLSSQSGGWAPNWPILPNSAIQPRGVFAVKMVASYWSFGRNIQIQAQVDGENYLPDSEQVLGAN